MKILFIIDRIELKYFEFNDLVTNFWLIKEFLNEKHEVYICTIDNLSLTDKTAYSYCYKTYYKDNNIFYSKEFIKNKINDFDLVMFRPDPPVDLDYINATYIFDYVDSNKTFIINNPKTLRNFNEKLHACYFQELMPEYIVTSTKKDIIEFLNKNKEIILKPLNKCFGSGVMYLKKNDKNTAAIINTVTNNGTTLVMVQKYLSSAIKGDKRVLILGDEVYDYCVRKLPSNNDFKFCEHNDKCVIKDTITKKEKQKFTILAKELNKMGIYMAGLDVVDEKILEINITSPCYFIKEINNAFKINFEKIILNKIINLMK